MEEKTVIEQTARELLEKMGYTVDMNVEEREGMFWVTMSTEADAALLIGKHAHMLSSIQRILSVIIANKLGKKVDLLVDVNDYRAEQRVRLVGIADNVAQRVLDEKREARLSSFSPYERRIIHEHISQNYLTLSSKSEGEGEDRQLIICMKD